MSDWSKPFRTVLPRVVIFVSVFIIYIACLVTNHEVMSVPFEIPIYLTDGAPYVALLICIVVLVPFAVFRRTRRLSLHGFIAAAAVFAGYACFFAYWGLVDLPGGFAHWIMSSWGIVWLIDVLLLSVSGLIAFKLSREIVRDDHYEAQRPRISKEDAERIANSLAPHILVPPRRRFWVRLAVGIVALIFCFALGVAGTIENGMLRTGITPPRISIGGLYFIDLATTVLFLVLLNVTLSLFSRSAVARLSENQPVPVLYLRTFGSDALFFGNLRTASMSLLFGWEDTPERDLARAVRRIGPLIAIGRPGELLPPVGALRMYADDEHWVEVFKRLESISRLVILRIGTTEGLRTEFQHLVETVPPEKLVIYVPDSDRQQVYFAFARMATKVVPQNSPHPIALPNNPREALFLRFRPDWSPELVAPAGPSLRDRIRRRLLLGSNGPAVYHALYRIGAVNSAWYEFSLRECANAFVWLIIVSLLTFSLLSPLLGISVP
jgi:hypothetical protein